MVVGWWHHVTQRGDSHSDAHARRGEGGERGVCIALNWWYDMEMRGDRWVWLSALRKASRIWNSNATKGDDSGRSQA
jgi:jumonji domain-containing protein 7